MLEQFHVPEDSAVRVSHTALLETAKAMFERVGVPGDDARIAADALVRADLRGWTVTVCPNASYLPQRL